MGCLHKPADGLWAAATLVFFKNVIYLFFFYTPWPKLCLSFTARGFSCISNCQGCQPGPRRWGEGQKRCRCIRVLPLFSLYAFYRLHWSVSATGAPSSCAQHLQCWMNHGVMRVVHRADAPLYGCKMFCTLQVLIFIPAASKSHWTFEPWASLSLKVQLSVLRQPLSPITVHQGCCEMEPGAGDLSTLC